jgi:ABC-type Fe3+/spermidine/putrescine transport system ATPase subunit
MESPELPGAGEGPVKLQLAGVAFRYGTTEALKPVDFAVRAGEFVSILGPSGCGKTTMLRILAGLLRPSSGRVFLEGRDITHVPPERRPLTMVFQHLALFPHLSVGQNVGFGLKLQKIDKAEIQQSVAQMLSVVGLEGYETRSPHQLSGGQQQRVALARALITEPEILLLDEPLGALDFAIRKSMQSELKALQRRVGISFVYVTHDQTEAMSMSDRVVLMHQGDIVQDASPLETYLNPASPFAARFVGDTNLLQGIVTSPAGSPCRVQVRDGHMLAPATDGIVQGDRVVISLRPEHIEVAAAPGGTATTVTGTIVVQTFLGSDVVVEVDTALGHLAVRRPGVCANEGVVGDSITLTFETQNVRMFRLEDHEPTDALGEPTAAPRSR